jgi:hypothetical protein
MRALKNKLFPNSDMQNYFLSRREIIKNKLSRQQYLYNYLKKFTGVLLKVYLLISYRKKY